MTQVCERASVFNMNFLSENGLELLAAVERDEVKESFHLGVVAVVDPEGELYYSRGDVWSLIYPRSALKPIQAAAMREAGLKLPADQGVMTMASHHGTTRQLELVSKILESHGLSSDQLGCPEALPSNSRARLDAIPSRLQMNCSGKHAGFLATSKLNDWSVEKYLQRTHPMQKLVKKTIERYSGEKIKWTSVDGCGAPLHAITTFGLARAISQFVQRNPDLVNAAFDNPALIGDETTPDAGFLRQRLFAKLGAEGVFTVATVDGYALAMKVADGSLRPAAAFAGALLHKLGIISLKDYLLGTDTDHLEVKGGEKTIGGWVFYF